MKWCDLSHVGCQLYIHSESLDGKDKDTGLPDFRLKVIDSDLYKQSLVEGESLESAGYVDLGDNLFKRSSTTTLSAGEFIKVFGPENINESILKETSVEDFVFEGHIVDLRSQGIDFDMYHFEGDKRPTLLATVDLDKAIDTLKFSEIFTELSNETMDKTNSVFAHRKHGYRFESLDNSNSGKYLIYIRNINLNKNPISLLSKKFENKILSEGLKVEYKKFQPNKTFSTQEVSDILDRTNYRYKNINTLTPSAMDESFKDVLEQTGLKDEADNLKVYTLKGGVATLKALSKDRQSDYESIVNGLALFETPFNVVNQRQLNALGMGNNDFLESDQTYIASSDKDVLKELYGADDSDIEEVSIDVNKNKLISINGAMNLLVFTAPSNLLERRFSYLSDRNDFRMKVFFDKSLSLKKEVEQISTIIEVIDEKDPEIPVHWNKLKEKFVEFASLYNVVYSGIQSYEAGETYESLIGEPHIPNTLENAVLDSQKKYEQYISFMDKEQLEKERAELALRAEKERQGTIDSIIDFTESEKGQREIKKKERIEDFGEKIGGAVKDDFGWLNENIKRLSFEDYREKVSLMDDSDVARLAKKSVLIERFDPVALKDEGVEPSIAYGIKNLLTSLPVNADKSGMPAKHYISLIKKVNDILYRHRFEDTLGDFKDKVLMSVRREVMLDEEGGGKYYIRPETNPVFYSYVLKFDSLEEALVDYANKFRKKEVSEEERAELLKVALSTVDFNDSLLKLTQGGLGERFMRYTHRQPGAWMNKVHQATSSNFNSDPWAKMIKEPKSDSSIRLKKESQNEGSETGKTHADKLSEMIKEGVKVDRSDIKHLGHVIREGKDYKVNDINERIFAGYFGFRAIEFGEWLPQKERAEVLKHSFNALMDLSTAIDLPPKEISLGENLAIAFGSRGRSTALAHFEPERNVINLTRMKGAGSLAHEFGHALDRHIVNYLCDKYPSFESYTKGRNFISKLIYKDISPRRKKNRIDQNAISKMRETIINGADIDLFDSYIDLHNKMLFKPSSKESSINSYIDKVQFDKSYATRSLKNLISMLYRDIQQEIRSETRNGGSTNSEDRDLELKSFMRDVFLPVLDNKQFDEYCSQVLSNDFFPIEELSQNIEKIFSLKEKELDGERVNHEGTNDFHNPYFKDLGPDILNAKKEVIRKGFSEVDKLVDSLIKIPDSLKEGLSSIDKVEVFVNWDDGWGGLAGEGPKVLSKEDYQSIVDSGSDVTNFERITLNSDAFKLSKGIGEALDLDRYVFKYLIKNSNKIVQMYAERALYRSRTASNLDIDISKLGGTTVTSNLKVNTSFFDNASRLDTSKYYYRQPLEMFARSFESYVYDKVSQDGGASDYLVSSSKAPELQNKRLSRYPLGLERESINESMQELLFNYSRAMNRNANNELSDSENDSKDSLEQER